MSLVFLGSRWKHYDTRLQFRRQRLTPLSNNVSLVDVSERMRAVLPVFEGTSDDLLVRSEGWPDSTHGNVYCSNNAFHMPHAEVTIPT